MGRKCLVIITLLVTLTMLLASCGGPAATQQTQGSDSSAKVADNATATTPVAGTKLEEVKLTWYTEGDPSKDNDEIMAAINAILKEKINATIDYKFTTWTDTSSKYNLLLSSGEPIDGIITLQWEHYFKYAKDGAFQDLTDMIPVDAPELNKQITAQQWKEASVDGRVYCIPQNVKQYDLDGWMYRDDWREEFGMQPLKTIDDLQAYMQACIDKKGITPLNGNSGSAIGRLMQSYLGYEDIAGEEALPVKIKSYNTPNEIITVPFTDEYLQFAKMVKTWADKGFWKKDSISNTVDTREAFDQGTGAIHWANLGGAAAKAREWATKNDWKLGYFPFTYFHNYAIPTISASTGWAIPKAAKNAERSLMAMEAIRTNQDLYDLIMYGIKDKNWSLAEDGKSYYAPAKGTEATNSKVDWANWNFRTAALDRNPAGEWAGYKPLLDYYESISVPNIYTSFALDAQPFQSELAAVSNIQAKYENQFLFGLGNTDDLVAQYRKELTNAGIEKIRAEVEKEVFDYYDKAGIKH